MGANRGPGKKEFSMKSGMALVPAPASAQLLVLPAAYAIMKGLGIREIADNDVAFIGHAEV